MRTNIHKNKILSVLKKHHLLSISDIHKEITTADYSTVYRNVEQLAADNEIRRVVLGKNNVMYELNDKENQHDHFLCNDCGDIESVNISYEKLSILNEREVTDVLLKGLCEKCH